MSFPSDSKPTSLSVAKRPSLCCSQLRLLLAAALIAMAMMPSLVQAQTATKIFVASFGSDANDGSRGAPKRNFQAAHDALAAGGEIVALDTAGYGVLSITKALGVTVPPGVTGFITTTSGTAAVTINAPSAAVTLQGLTLSTTGGTTSGIAVTNVGKLTLLDCAITGFDSHAIQLVPASGAVTLTAKNTVLRDSAIGIFVPATAAADATVVLEGCRFESNGSAGVDIIGSGTSGVSHRVQVQNSLFAGNATGIVLFGATNRLVVSDSAFSANGTGISIAASGATAKVDGCTITGNGAGVSRAGGAVLLSRGNNAVEDNTTDGTFSGSYSAK